jgi:O-acetyl-ADP-ribose deacetylase (regulator of RNase III)
MSFLHSVFRCLSLSDKAVAVAVAYNAIATGSFSFFRDFVQALYWRKVQSWKRNEEILTAGGGEERRESVHVCTYDKEREKDGVKY